MCTKGGGSLSSSFILWDDRDSRVCSYSRVFRGSSDTRPSRSRVFGRVAEMRRRNQRKGRSKSQLGRRREVTRSPQLSWREGEIRGTAGWREVLRLQPADFLCPILDSHRLVPFWHDYSDRQRITFYTTAQLFPTRRR